MPKKQQNGLSPNQKWQAIPQQFKELITRNVWCTNCQHGVRILDYRVYSAGPDIVLRGRCATCNGDVARVVEQE